MIMGGRAFFKKGKKKTNSRRSSLRRASDKSSKSSKQQSRHVIAIPEGPDWFRVIKFSLAEEYTVKVIDDWQ